MLAYGYGLFVEPKSRQAEFRVRVYVFCCLNVVKTSHKRVLLILCFREKNVSLVYEIMLWDTTLWVFFVQLCRTVLRVAFFEGTSIVVLLSWLRLR